MRTGYINPLSTLLGMLAGIAAILAFALWNENDSRTAYLDTIDNRLRQSVISAGQNIGDSIEMAELVLTGLKVEMTARGGAQSLKSRLTSMITQFIRHADDIRTLHVIGSKGEIIATTAENADPSTNLADRDYFRYHLNNPSDETLLGPPIVSRLTGEEIVTLTTRLEDQDGRFAGVIVVHIAVHRINTFLNRYLSTVPGSSAILSRHDGTVIGASPDRVDLIGQKIDMQRDAAQFPYNAVKAVTIEAWPLDNVVRHTAVYESRYPPFVLIVGAAQEAVLANWAQGARTRWLVGIALLVIALALCLHWYRQARLHDISRAMLGQKEQELQLLADASGDLIERLSVEGIREYVSAASNQVLGLAPAALLGTTAFDHLPTEDRPAMIERLKHFTSENKPQRVLTRYLHPEGREVWLESTLSCLKDRNTVTGIVAITRDVTAHKNNHDELDTLAKTDTLTGLANRRAFDAGIAEKLEMARQFEHPLSLLMLDVDRFKLFNDTYGHASGDECLKAIAAGISSVTRRTDLTARFGGEEFAIVLSNADETNARMVAEKIRRCIASLRLPHDKNTPWGYATISIGIATVRPGNAMPHDATALFRAADTALYAAKQQGRNRLVAAGDLPTMEDQAISA